MSTGHDGLIQIYAKQLRLPTVTDVAAMVREATEHHWGYEEFLQAVLAREVEQRQENQRRRRVKAARFPQMRSVL